ncbi:coiled-coil domain-containing protein 88B [Cyclospora cayetanensis]|uniref:Coiled-coil domain-containing protein 88B n=1 Tax=Cyclospora cayetanensis TaxID=88456 RepID=A0A6P6RR39_9EIME|nr:coiled-coil domain-containing protein 88B [Cyclospora cayetanensis]
MGNPDVPVPPEVGDALQFLEEASSWAETSAGWASSTSPSDTEKYLGALRVLSHACRRAEVRDAVLHWHTSHKMPSQMEGLPEELPILRHFYRVFCCVSATCLAEAGIDYKGPTPNPAVDFNGASQGGTADGGSSAEEWLARGVSLHAAIQRSSLASASLRQVVMALYPLTSCLCNSRDAADAAALLQTPEGSHCFSLLASLAAAASEEEAKTLPASAAAAPTPGASTCASGKATESPSAAESSSNDSALLLAVLGAYEGPLALPGIAVSVRSGPLKALHKAVQRGAARLLGKAASLPDAATAVVAWLVYRRLSSSSSSSISGGDGSFSSPNVRHLLALLIASVRNHLRRPLEQRVSALCLREALKEPRMLHAVSGPTQDAALAFAAVCLQSLQAVAAAAEEAASEELLKHPPSDSEKAASVRKQQLAAAAPIAEMLALLCARSAAVRDSVASRLDMLPSTQQGPAAVAPPPPPTATGDDGSTYSNSDSRENPAERQQQHEHQHQQQPPVQPSPGRSRSSAALSAASLPALFFVTAHADDLGCAYTAAFLELCLRTRSNRGIGRFLSSEQREEAVVSLASNAGLLTRHSTRRGRGLRATACMSLLAALWEKTDAMGSAVETVCILPLAADGESAARRGDTALLLQLLHASLDFSACTKRHTARSMRLLQQSAAALAAGPLGSPQTAAEAEDALLLVHKCSALVSAGVSVLDAGFPYSTAAAASVLLQEEPRTVFSISRRHLCTAVCSSRSGAPPVADRASASMDGSWFLSGRPLATALAEESRKRKVEMRGLQQSREDAKLTAAQAAQRLVVTNEAHEVLNALYFSRLEIGDFQMELSRLKEAAERQECLHATEQQRLADEARKLRRELEMEQQRGRDLVAEFQRLLDAKEAAIASLQLSLGEGRSLQGSKESELSRELQVQTAINVKQKEELAKQEAKLHATLERQQQTANSLTALTARHRQLQEEKSKLQISYEKVQEENEQQFRQLILVMKALAEQQAANEALKEARMCSEAQEEEQTKLKLQKLEQQLQQSSREQESQARAASLRQVSLEEQLRAFEKENEYLKAMSRRNESTIEDLEKRLQAAVETATGAKAAAAAKTEVLKNMQKVQIYVTQSPFGLFAFALSSWASRDCVQQSGHPTFQL